MSNSRNTTVLFTVAGAAAFFVAVYLAIFGRALNQSEPHMAIAIALPKAFVSSEAVRVDSQTYLAKNSRSFIAEMALQGFAEAEQFGSAYIFTKDGKRYIADSRMYSSYFMLFSYPKES